MTECHISSLSVQTLIQCPSSQPLAVRQTSCLLILELHWKQLRQILATWGRSHQQGNINNPEQIH